MVKKKSKSHKCEHPQSELDAEIDDWMQTDNQDQNLVPCPRCGHYIMDEDVYDRLCDGVNETTGEYCPNIYHNICLDQEEMQLDSGGFWYCPDCKANQFGATTCQPVSEDATIPGEPAKSIPIASKSVPIVISALEIPTKGSKGTQGAASKAASFKTKKAQQPAFVPPAAYLEVLGVQDGNLPPPSASQTPRGPVSARSSPDKKGRHFTRGQVTDKIGAGLWSVKTPTSELAESVKNGLITDNKTESFKFWQPDLTKMDEETRDLYRFIEDGMNEGKKEDDSIQKQQDQLARLIANRDKKKEPLPPLKDRRLSEPKVPNPSNNQEGETHEEEKKGKTRAPSKTEPPKAEPKEASKQQPKSKACTIS